MVWDELNGLNRREFAEVAESSINRLTEFLASPAVRVMVGLSSRAIEFRQVMDGSEIVLVNLGHNDVLSAENARVVGSLIINDLFLTALGRSEQVANVVPSASTSTRHTISSPATWSASSTRAASSVSTPSLRTSASGSSGSGARASITP